MLNKNIIMPDYKNSIMNITVSILKYYGAETQHSSITEIDSILHKNYKNVVLLILDGMGSDILDYHLPENSLFRKHKIKDITSVYPSTTPVAMTSINSGLSPLEHGWIGWNCYFKESNQELELFMNKDFYSHKQAPTSNFVNSIIGYEFINSQISRSTQKKVAAYEVPPPFRPDGVKSTSEMFSRIKELCQSDEKKFIYAYWDDPDATMHAIGTRSEEITGIIKRINNELSDTLPYLKDTLIILTADHGMIDIKEHVFLNDIAELDECLNALPSLNNRAMSFKVKSDKKDIFEKRFNACFKDSHLLLDKKQFIKLLGPGIPHRKINDFVGDFVALAVGNKMLQYRALEHQGYSWMKASHAGLTRAEMIVPLIIIECPYVKGT